jgi:hypothetical protein
MKPIGKLTLVPMQGTEEVTVDVLRVTVRNRSPSLDVRWGISGVYELRLSSNVLLSIPKFRVRGRDPTLWKCADKDLPAAWRLWWDHSFLSEREKKRRCPTVHWPLGDREDRA